MAFKGFRAPALPLAQPIYDQRQMDEFLRALRIYFNVLDSKVPIQSELFIGDIQTSVSSAITATGTTQATATELINSINNVTVVTATDDGVRLPVAKSGVTVLVRNSDSTDTLEIYPANGAEIDSLGVDNPYSLSAGSTVQLYATTTTQWYSI